MFFFGCCQTTQLHSGCFSIGLSLEFFSRMILLSFLDSILAGLISRHFGLFSKFSLWSLCLLQEKCMTKDIVYKATVATGNTNRTKHYIGMTASVTYSMTVYVN